MAQKDRNLELEEVDMYVLFARMFADITREVEARFGREGIEAVREGVRQFGLRRGQNIAARARSMGHDADPAHYLSCYDMGRSDYFTSEDRVTEEEVEQLFTQCVFADTWKKDGDEDLGIHYCQMIDPAIAEGYDPSFQCIHDKHFFTDGVCHFCFRRENEKPD